MTSPLLETKLRPPRPRRGAIGRPRLVERIERGIEGKLTLVSAPPGFGKTSLLAEWRAAMPEGMSVGWLSLDASDNGTETFWTYVTAALGVAAPGTGARALPLLSEQALEPALTNLLNDLEKLAEDTVLVLDDFHVIEAREIHEGMAFLLDHLPAQVHLVLATRADPPLPLARLRARGELVEIRAGDLRFSRAEVTAYFKDSIGLALDDRDLAALDERTEGWIAALQLAGLSMQGRDDVSSFIAGFAGDDRYVIDYLVEEVLQRQPEPIRQFLLATSILARLSGSLCDAVTGQDGGEATLRALERANLFTVPLDDRREWYRYHHLFADVLRARLTGEHPGWAVELHGRASRWYAEHDEQLDAVRHAFAAGDHEWAAETLERAIPELRRARQEAAMQQWLEGLPDELVRRRPVLGVHRAGVLLANGDVDGAEALLRDAEQWLAATEDALDQRKTGSSEVGVGDQEGLRRLVPQLAMYRAALAMAAGDTEGVVAHARRALAVVGDDDDYERGGAAGFLALASWHDGDLEMAHRHWSTAQASLRKAGHVVDAIGCARPLALIRIGQGRLREAMETYARGLALATEERATPLRGAADMHVGMSELFIEWNDLDRAEQHLVESRSLGQHAALAQNPYRWCAAMSRVRLTHGDVDGALALLDEAERLYVSEYYPDVRPVPAVRARIWASHGRLADAIQWARERGLSLDDDVSYLREFEHITLVRILMAQQLKGGTRGSFGAAVGLLGRLLTAAEDAGRIASVIEILALQALSLQARGDVPGALVPLARALALAEPEGYVRIFVDEGDRMAALLDRAEAEGIAVEYVHRLLAAHRGLSSASAQQALAEPLSKRELDVLRLLATELDGPRIANELFVGVSTVRSHTKSIYAKLGVNNRRAAVRRGEALGLLSRASSR